MQTFNLKYVFQSQPRTHQLQLKQRELPLHEAAMHLIVLHYGDGENSLVMPAANATPTEILQHADSLDISQVEVTPAGL